MKITCLKKDLCGRKRETFSCILKIYMFDKIQTTNLYVVFSHFSLYSKLRPHTYASSTDESSYNKKKEEKKTNANVSRHIRSIYKCPIYDNIYKYISMTMLKIRYPFWHVLQSYAKKFIFVQFFFCSLLLLLFVGRYIIYYICFWLSNSSRKSERLESHRIR